jgi:chorismate mutase
VSIRRVARRLTLPLLAVALLTTAVPAFAATPGDSDGTPGPLGPLTGLVIQRLVVSDQVAAAKFGTGQSIDDPAREQQELTGVRQSAETLGIDPTAAVAFFQQQITASKVVQQGLFDRWTAHPDQAPTTRPDLGTIRDELDRLTTELLQQLVAEQHLSASGLPCRVDLGVARIGETLRHRLDALHRHALAVALSATCVA